MKKIVGFFFCTILLGAIFFFIGGAKEGSLVKTEVAGPFTPENTQIQFDLDETVLEKNRLGLWLELIKYLNYRVDLLIPLLFTNFDARYISCAIGHPWSLYYNAIHTPQLQPYVDGFMKMVAASHQWVPGAHDIIVRLKEKGYSIAYVTNKDRISYEYVAQYLGESLTTLPDKVLVFYREQSDPIMLYIKEFLDNPATSDSQFKTVLETVYNQKETALIKYAYEMKPSQAYVKKQREVAGSKKIIFFDDLAKNVSAAAFDKNMVGIQVFQSARTILEPLIELGVIDPVDQKDAALIAHLNQYENSGILGLVQKSWRAFKRRINPPVRVHAPIPVGNP